MGFNSGFKGLKSKKFLFVIDALWWYSDVKVFIVNFKKEPFGRPVNKMDIFTSLLIR